MLKYKNKMDFYNVLLFSLLKEKYEKEQEGESFKEWLAFQFEHNYDMFINAITKESYR